MNDKVVEVSNNCFSFSGLDGQRGLSVMNKSLTRMSERTNRAVGLGDALQGAKFHERLIENIRGGIAHQLPCFFKKYVLFFGGGNFLPPSQRGEPIRGTHFRPRPAPVLVRQWKQWRRRYSFRCPEAGVIRCKKWEKI